MKKESVITKIETLKEKEQTDWVEEQIAFLESELDGKGTTLKTKESK